MAGRLEALPAAVPPVLVGSGVPDAVAASAPAAAACCVDTPGAPSPPAEAANGDAGGCPAAPDGPTVAPPPSVVEAASTAAAAAALPDSALAAGVLLLPLALASSPATAALPGASTPEGVAGDEAATAPSEAAIAAAGAGLLLPGRPWWLLPPAAASLAVSRASSTRACARPSTAAPTLHGHTTSMKSFDLIDLSVLTVATDFHHLKPRTCLGEAVRRVWFVRARHGRLRACVP